jgi:predicted nucleic acid-binding protein
LSVALENPYVIDSSALLTLIEDEEGADRVQEVLREGDVILPWLVLMEVYYISQQENGKPEADRRYALMRHLPVEIIWEMDEPTLLTAARFKAEHRLSFADAVIAALAKRRGAVLLHKDPEYDALTEHIEAEALPYKASRSRR